MAAILEVYEIRSEEEFKAAGHVLNDAYEKPFNSFWEVLKGHSEDEMLSRLWQWHTATPGSQWIGVRKKTGGSETIIGMAQWILHETNPFEHGNSIPPVYWWNDVYMKDITEQVFETFFGGRPKYSSKPHVLLNICCVAQGARRQGAGALLMKYGQDLADAKGLESLVEATFDGIRLYEFAGFRQLVSFVVDAALPEKFEQDKEAWLLVRSRIFPTAYPGMVMWRPKGGIWKRGDAYPSHK